MGLAQTNQRGRRENPFPSTHPSSEDLVDGGGFLERALGLDDGPHLLHVEHEGVQRLLDVGLLARVARRRRGALVRFACKKRKKRALLESEEVWYGMVCLALLLKYAKILTTMATSLLGFFGRALLNNLQHSYSNQCF